ncbi:Panthothenate kinase [Phaeobacter piscinae]|uniref:Panthothenate kinase n=1 Tax=Phaeobacter piscinae TaxID=1580596 RepID=A0AAN1GST4_9RHOB|nr:nucleoside/nucleotide kinase family protein [Phaeobacter piscinae]ATG44496.1 Panthothenate kinase [Phaeobacter piscinae]AUR36810.1 Panthothenate kinase [Phaeobacter piscinae]
MTREVTSLADLVTAIEALPCRPGRARRLVALAGAPGSGKSTLAELLVRALCAQGTSAAVVPMDGFHLDNRLLSEMDLLARKGAPESFDRAGFQRLIAAMAVDEEVIYPEFDRARDIAIAGAARVDAAVEVAVVEGNYLMFDAPGWRDLAALWDVSVRVDVPREMLRERLVARWQAHGLSDAEAEARAEGNDLANADRVAAASLPVDVIWRGKTE